MSANYAAGLSPYENKGKCGLPEIFDDDATVSAKVLLLSDWVRNSRHMVAHTGAGISTAAGIPDFRGPSGVWTLEKRGAVPKTNIDFADAQPTFSHLALVAMESTSLLKYLITQNIDGLHLRSGFPRDRMSELHGNVFVEECATCKRRRVLDKPTSTIGLKLTGNCCNKGEVETERGGRPCRGKMKDTVLDWEDHLPERDSLMAEHHSRLADLSLCLGTTLQITPAGTFPTWAKKNTGGKLVIINLQRTKHHKKADLVIHAKIDVVMGRLLSNLSITHPSANAVVTYCERSRHGSPELPKELLRHGSKSDSPPVLANRERKKRQLCQTEERVQQFPKR